MKKFLSMATLSLSLTSAWALADHSEPACVGTNVDASLHGTYKSFGDVENVRISANAVSTDKGSFVAWTCEKNGILILVLEFVNDLEGNGNYESRAIAMSAKNMLDFGEVVGNQIDPFNIDPKLKAPLSKEGLLKRMKKNQVIFYQKN